MVNPDTGAGGVDDGSEVGRGSDPLDPSDDFPVGLTRSHRPVDPTRRRAARTSQVGEGTPTRCRCEAIAPATGEPFDPSGAP